jgi:hypothetical protein
MINLSVEEFHSVTSCAGDFAVEWNSIVLRFGHPGPTVWHPCSKSARMCSLEQSLLSFQNLEWHSKLAKSCGMSELEITWGTTLVLYPRKQQPWHSHLAGKSPIREVAELELWTQISWPPIQGSSPMHLAGSLEKEHLWVAHCFIDQEHCDLTSSSCTYSHTLHGATTEITGRRVWLVP